MKHKKLPLTDADGEVRELTTSDLKEFKSFEHLPTELQTLLKKRGRPVSAHKKILTTIRFDQDVIDALKLKAEKDHTKWQSIANGILRKQLGL